MGLKRRTKRPFRPARNGDSRYSLISPGASRRCTASSPTCVPRRAGYVTEKRPQHYHDPPSLHVGANHRREVRALTRGALDFGSVL